MSIRPNLGILQDRGVGLVGAWVMSLVRVLPTTGETTFNTFRSPVRVMTSHIDGGRNAFSWFPQKT